MEDLLAMPMSQIQRRRSLVKQIRRTKRELRELAQEPIESPSEILTPEGLERLQRFLTLKATLNRLQLSLLLMDLNCTLAELHKAGGLLSLSEEAHKGISEIRGDL